MKYSILFAISLALALPLYAGHKKGAHPKAKPTAEQVFTKKDKNHDGFLSKDEFIGKAKKVVKKGKRFAKLDTNNDGKLSLQEFTAKVAKGKHHGKGKGKGKGKRQNAAPVTPSSQNQ
ncbi:MAG: EF-hand domain-containing protein [Verrucomicrobiota bacterium]